MVLNHYYYNLIVTFNNTCKHEMLAMITVISQVSVLSNLSVATDMLKRPVDLDKCT